MQPHTVYLMIWYWTCW